MWSTALKTVIDDFFSSMVLWFDLVNERFFNFKMQRPFNVWVSWFLWTIVYSNIGKWCARASTDWDLCAPFFQTSSRFIVSWINNDQLNQYTQNNVALFVAKNLAKEKNATSNNNILITGEHICFLSFRLEIAAIYR